MFLVLVILCAVLAILISLNPLVSRHLSVLLTFGKYPATYGSTCDTTPPLDASKSTRFTTHKHCFNATGDFYWYDAAHNETLMRELLSRALEDHCPVLIHRPFKDHKCYERLRDLGARKPNIKLRVKENTDAAMDEVNLFPGISSDDAPGLRRAVSTPIYSLLNEYDQGYSKKFTAFDPTLSGFDYEELWGLNLDWLKGKAGSTFMSNYNRSVATTPFHSAFWESFGYQCQGSKRWYMMTPEDALPVVRVHNIFTQMKDCKDRKDIANFIFSTRSDADTMFYFPPYWAHSVVTQQGLSVLLNYRSLNLKRIFQDSPLVGTLTLSSLIYYGLFFSNYDPDEVSYYYRTGTVPPLNGKQRSRWFAWFSILDTLYKKFD